MVGTTNRPITRSQSRAVANRLNNLNQNSKDIVSEALSKVDILSERAKQTTAELLDYRPQAEAVQMRAFITVGTTKFHSLVQRALSAEVLSLLRELGFTEVSIQAGDMELQPLIDGLEGGEVINKSEEVVNIRWRDLKIRLRRFYPSLEREMRDADLIVGHGGAGTCMEALALKKPLVVVVNSALMSNHQSELADRLARDHHCLVASSAEKLVDALRDPALMTPAPFPPPAGSSVFSQFLSDVLDF
ncbi:N-acetylglucosaminyldiphosphodolichol N-acetylglucosaminyltransferase [Aphelenchoides fujianensis]|nr:N-acetylglucosaminyldiphosphodolichol N-acetylglucosaminyltransferase [Aphelenchoides fujianensis]